MAILQMRPQLFSQKERTESLVAALRSADFYHGLTQALYEVEQYHPPEIIETLLNCLLDRESGVLAHFAGMLIYFTEKLMCHLIGRSVRSTSDSTHQTDFREKWPFVNCVRLSASMPLNI